MHRLPAIVGTLAAVAGAYFTKDWKPAPSDRLRGRAVTVAAAGSDAVAPKPEVEKPIVPALPVVRREIEGVMLPKSERAGDIYAKSAVELHLEIDGDGESALTWHGGVKPVSVASFASLQKSLAERQGRAVVIVADERATWQWVVWVLQTAQESYLTEGWIGACRAATPKTLQGFPMPVPATKDVPMPAATERFVVTLKSGAADEPTEVTADGKPLKDVMADLKSAWAKWSAANPKWADTSTAERTHVVLDVPGITPTGKVVPVIDALRAAGIKSERYIGAMVPRPR